MSSIKRHPKKGKTQGEQMDERQLPATLTPDQAHAILGGNDVISRATFYAAIKRNQVPHLRLGARRILIPRVAFLRWLEAAGLHMAGRPETEA